jgi:hypothetical protein
MVDQMGTVVLLYDVGTTGTKVEEVEFTPVGSVAVDDRVDEIGAVPGGAVPVPQYEVTALVLLPYGAVG